MTNCFRANCSRTEQLRQLIIAAVVLLPLTVLAVGLMLFLPTDTKERIADILFHAHRATEQSMTPPPTHP
jgi:hypothetical protein